MAHFLITKNEKFQPAPWISEKRLGLLPLLYEMYKVKGNKYRLFLLMKLIYQVTGKSTEPLYFQSNESLIRQFQRKNIVQNTKCRLSILTCTLHREPITKNKDRCQEFTKLSIQWLALQLLLFKRNPTPPSNIIRLNWNYY